MILREKSEGVRRRLLNRAAAGGEGQTYVARSTGRTADGTVAAEFEVTWSFKRRG